MNLKERLFHSVLFEIGAVIVGAAAISATGAGDAHTAVGVGIAMSLVAMVWNLVYNWGFDQLFTGRREERGAAVRLLHILAFEAGLLVATVPMIAYSLKLSLWQAFLADIALTCIITFYGYLYNLAYDKLRVKWVRAAA